MKIIAILLTVGLLTLSCSNKLTESKVEKIVSECLEQNPIYGEANIVSGQISLYAFEYLERYKKLEKNGFLKIEEKSPSNGWYTKYYEITLSEKIKPYIIDSEEGISGKFLLNKVKLYTLKVDKIGSIQEIPSMNRAEVSVTYDKGDKTPLYEYFQTDKTEYTTKKINLKKTENQGWIFCEK